jgi:hypothetical protein
VVAAEAGRPSEDQTSGVGVGVLTTGFFLGMGLFGLGFSAFTTVPFGGKGFGDRTAGIVGA